MNIGGTGVGPTGDLNYALYIDGTANTNALNINSGGTLGMEGGIYSTKNITINTGGALKNGSTSAGYAINGSGGIILAGGAISSAGGQWTFNQAVSGYGAISAPVTNASTVTANNSTNALNISGAFTNSTGGTVTVNDAAALNLTAAFTNGFTYDHTPVLNIGTTPGSTAVMTIGTGGGLTNNGVLNVNGSLNNNTATAVALTPSGAQANLNGGTLDGSGAGGFTNAGTLNGYGNIFANLTNTSTSSSAGIINATGNINVAGNTVTNNATGTHRGTVNLNSYTLNNTSANTFTMTGGYAYLAGGQITSTGGGAISTSSQISGYGTLAAPITYSGTITANTPGQTLAITGPLTYANSAPLSATLYANGGNLLLEGQVNGGTIAANSGSEVDLNGANLNGPTGFFNYLYLGMSSGGSGALKLTGDSQMSNNISVNANMPLLVNGHTLTANNLALGLPSGVNLDVGTGNLNINGPMSVYSGGGILLGGGNIIGNAVNTLSGGVTGHGDITAKLQASNVTATGGTLYIDGGAALNLMDGTHNNTNMSSSSGSILDIRSTLTNPAYNGFAFTSYISPNGGVVNLDGATLTSTGNMNIQLNAGTVNVTNDSIFNGPVNSLATLGINSGATLTNNGILNTNTTTMTNNGGTLNNALGGAITGTGSYVQTAGKTVNNGSMTQASVDIKAGILSGTGTINAPVTLESGATIAPADAIGKLTINGDFTSVDGNFKFEIQGDPGLNGVNNGNYDELFINGQAIVSGGTIEADFINGYMPSPGEYWNIFDSTKPFDWTPSPSLVVTGLDGSGEFAKLVYQADGNGGWEEGLLVTTPEPGTLLLLGLGLLGLGGFKCRREGAA